MPQQIDVPGMGVVEFPDGMDDKAISAAIQRTLAIQAENTKIDADYAADDANLPLGKRVGIGIGRGMVDIAQGAKQLALLGGEKVGLVDQGRTAQYTKDTDKERALYDNTAVGKSTGAKAARLATNVAPYMIPGVGTGGLLARAGAGLLERAGAGALTNAAVGAAQYVPDGGSRGFNMGISGLAGAAGPLVGAGLGSSNALLSGLSRTAVGAGTGATVANLAGLDPLGGAVAGGLAGLGMPVGVKAINAIRGGTESPAEQAIIAAGKKANVPVYASDARPGSPMLQGANTLLEGMPAPLGMRAARNEQMQAAGVAAKKVNDDLQKEMLTTQFGGRTGYARLQQAAQGTGARATVAQQLLKDIENSGDDWSRIIQTSGDVKLFRAKLIADRKYGKLSSAADAYGEVPRSQTLGGIESALKNEMKSDLPDKGLINTLNTLKQNLGDPTRSRNYSDLRDTMGRVGQMISDTYKGSNAAMGTAATGPLQMVKNAIKADLDKFAQQQGPELKTLWRNADSFYQRAVAPAKDKRLAETLTTADPDTIYSKWMMKGDMKDRATRFYGALDDKGRAAVRYGMVNKAYKEAAKAKEGYFSPGAMAAELNKEVGARGVFFKGQDKAEMDGFANLMRHVDRSFQVVNAPDTGKKSVPGLMAILMGALGYGAHMAGVTVPQIAAGLGGVGVLKVLMTTDAGRRFLLASSKMKPGSAAMSNAVEKMNTILQRGAAVQIGQAQ